MAKYWDIPSNIDIPAWGIIRRDNADTSTSWTASGGKRAECTISFNFTL